MPKLHPDDISIGEDEWIAYVDVTNRPHEQIVRIDDLIAPAEPFWLALEVHCVADCCGINAFSFWPEDIVRARSTLDHQLLKSTLASLHQFLQQSSADTFTSRRWNQIFDKPVLLKLVEHIQKHLGSEKEP